jgi:hypothetical protein
MTEHPSEAKNELAEWIEELLPRGEAACTRDGGSRPLDLEELEKALRGSNDRRGAARRRHAA